MTAFSAPEQTVITSDDRVLHAAVAAYLGRYRGQSRLHTGSDLKIFLAWCVDQGLEPLCVGRVDIEQHVRWLQEIRYYQPSTVSRRLSVVVDFFRVFVIDQIPPSAADYVGRPPVPAESPRLGLGLGLGLGHLQFEAVCTDAAILGCSRTRETILARGCRWVRHRARLHVGRIAGC
jgi:integrase/recombinase XerD